MSKLTIREEMVDVKENVGVMWPAAVTDLP